jgi:Na+/melibiose symporter-like transporter
MVGPLYLGFYLLAMFLMSFYKLDKKRHAEILAELEKRRDAASL